MARIGIVSNANANRGRNNGFHAGLVQIAQNRPSVHHRITRSPEEVADAVCSFYQEGIEVLVSDGGDGGLSELMTHEIRFVHAPHILRYSPFGQRLFVPLNTGTVNVFASHLGIDDPIAMLAYLESASLDELRANAQRFQTLEIAVEGEQPRYGFMFGNGIMHTAFKLYDEALQKSRNAFWAVLRILGSLASKRVRALYKPITAALEIEGHIAHGKPSDYTTMLASTLDLTIPVPHLAIAPFRNANLGQFNFLTTRYHLGLWKLLGHAYRLVRGEKPEGKDFVNTFVPSVTIRASRSSLSYMLDGTNYTISGSPYEKIKCTVSVGPYVSLVGVGR